MSEAMARSGPPAPTQPPQPAFIDSESLQKLIDNQTRELALRQQELLLKQQENSYAHDYAQRALDAQAADREKGRQHHQTYRRERLYFGAFAMLLITGFLIYTLSAGKDAFASEVLKTIFAFLAGGGVGYSIRNKPRPEDGKPSSTPRPEKESSG